MNMHKNKLPTHAARIRLYRICFRMLDLRSIMPGWIPGFRIRSLAFFRTGYKDGKR